MFNVFFLSYDELNADLNYMHLKSLRPDAQRVHGVEGIMNAHKECARRSKTDNFWVIDGDCFVNRDFDWTVPVHVPTIRNALVLWFSRNAVNGLAYGNGSVKLFPKYPVLMREREDIDFTMEVCKSYYVNSIVAENRFNTSPFMSWRGGFREGVNLQTQILREKDPERRYDLEDTMDVWCTVGSEKKYGTYCIRGANEGRRYAIRHKDSPDKLYKINEFRWLKRRFNG